MTTNHDPTPAEHVRQRVITLVDNFAGDDAVTRALVLACVLFATVDRVPDVVAEVIDRAVLDMAQIEYELDVDDGEAA